MCPNRLCHAVCLALRGLTSRGKLVVSKRFYLNSETGGKANSNWMFLNFQGSHPRFRPAEGMTYHWESSWSAYLWVAFHPGEGLMEQIMPDTKENTGSHARISWTGAGSIEK